MENYNRKMLLLIVAVASACLLFLDIVAENFVDETSFHSTYTNLHIYSNCKLIKFVVFVCTDEQLCGGWGDRQKGIISTYLLAMLMNRTFSIIHNKPCDIYNFLVPNKYNWRTCHKYLEKMLHSSPNYVDFQSLLDCHNIDACNQNQVIFIKTNQIWNEKLLSHPYAARRIPWAPNRTIPEVSKIVLSLLFRPDVGLEDAVQKFTHQIGDEKKLICSHIRVGRNPTMPNDENRPSGVPNVSVIFSFLKHYEDGNKYAIFIAADSEDIRRQATISFKNSLSTNLSLIHVDRIRKEQINVACNGLYAALTEQYILSRCDVLLLTRSGFGAMSAFLGKHLQTVYIFYQETCTIFEVTLNGIQHYFKLT